MIEQFDYWHWQLLIGMSALCVMLPFSLLKQAPLSLKLLWAYSLLSPLWVFHHPYRFPQFGLEFDLTTAQAFSEILLIPLAVIVMPARVFRHYRKAFVAVAIVESFLICFFGRGFCGGTSFDSALSAAALPFSGLYGLAILPGIFTTFGSTAIGIMCAQAIGYAIYSRRYRWLWSVPVVIAAALTFQGASLIDPSGRQSMWKAYLPWWWDENLIWFGSRIGMFETLGQRVAAFQFNGMQVIQMHNDWLQMLFEGGAVGFGLLAWAFVDLVRKSFVATGWKLPCVLIGFGMFGLTYHPFRIFVSALFLACVVREILEVSSYEKPTSTVF